MKEIIFDEGVEVPGLKNSWTSKIQGNTQPFSFPHCDQACSAPCRCGSPGAACCVHQGFFLDAICFPLACNGQLTSILLKSSNRTIVVAGIESAN